ncbi:chitin deacetylase 8-like [Culicoides brevitarsis]|uniref:chitin deacetylase 8-like n=1 Tax=Culicoides brevitarsis TaxID=469753 RepID=UPI00307BE915
MNLKVFLKAFITFVFVIQHVFSAIEKCRKNNCFPPDCRCSTAQPPGNFPLEEVPQFVYLTFDDAVHEENIEFINKIFNESNYGFIGCPAVGTFFVSHEYTDYSIINKLYSEGHEIALHSITHSHFGNSDLNEMIAEFVGQRKIVSQFADIPESEMVGIRMPFLQLAGDHQYEMLSKYGFEYDFSRTQWNSKRMWPYTLDYETTQDCFLGPCHKKSYPGLWQIPLIVWRDKSGSPCAMADGCQNIPNDVDGLFEFFKDNFNRLYLSGAKAPFGFCIHAAWFKAEEPPQAGQHRLAAYIKFVRYLQTLDDVFIVSSSEVIDWIKYPIPVSLMKKQTKNCRPITVPCKPKQCNVCKGREARWFVSCQQQCPKSYPWLDNFDGNNDCK